MFSLFLALGAAPPAPLYTLRPDVVGGRFGSAVAAGDLDGDGVAELLVGDHGAGLDVEGAVYVFPGPSFGEPWTFRGADGDGAFGWGLAWLGDLDGDGYADLAGGAPEAGSGLEGRVLVAWGGPAGPVEGPEWRPTSARAHAGYALAPALDGEGGAALVVGAPGGAGSVWLLRAEGGVLVEAGSVYGDTAGGALGTSVQSLGDLDGDGDGELLVGAAGAGEGEAWVLAGDAAGPSLVRRVVGTSGCSQFGLTVVAAELSGEGEATVDTPFGPSTLDLVVGADAYCDAGGAVAIFRGEEGWAAEPEELLGDGGPSTYFAHSLSAGDLNGDGRPELLVGEEGRDAFAGAAHVYAGTPAGPRRVERLSRAGERPAAWYGHVSTVVPDLDGDGYDDYAVGTFAYSGYVEVWPGGPDLDDDGVDAVLDADDADPTVGADTGAGDTGDTGPGDSGDPDDTGDTEDSADTGESGDRDTGDSAGDSPGDSAGDSDAEHTGTADTDGGAEGEKSGCGCATGAAPAIGLWAPLAGMVWAGWRGRRPRGRGCGVTAAFTRR